MNKVTIDRRSLNALMGSPGVRATLKIQAERVASAARSGAPVDSGAYRDSIGVEDSETGIGWARERVVARAPHSHIVESRTGNLARALGSAGG